MSYIIYNTEGIVLGARESGESDRLITFFTKDFGKINIFAKGVRFEKSKLNSHLNLFAHSRVSFVAGKHKAWRLIDAASFRAPSLPESGKSDASFAEAGPRSAARLDKIFSMGRVACFLDRMVQGEERDENLWHVARGALAFILKTDDAKFTSVSRHFEILTKARFLNFLGYVSVMSLKGSKGAKGAFKNVKLDFLLNSFELNDTILKQAVWFDRFLEKIIEKGVLASAL